MNVLGRYVVFHFGGNVKGRMSFRTPTDRRDCMEAILEGGHEGQGDWTVLASDGVRRKLRTAVEAFAVDTVTR